MFHCWLLIHFFKFFLIRASKGPKNQYDLSIEDLSRAQELVENGVLPVGDLYEIEANKSSAEKSLIDAENALTLAKLALAQLILIENYQDFDIVDENYDLEMSEILNKSPDIIYNYAVQNKNEIRVAETNVEIAKKSLELNKSFLQPRLSAFYSFSSRIAYGDRLVGTGNFDLVPIGFVQGTNQPVVAPFQQTMSKHHFTEQFDK